MQGTSDAVIAETASALADGLKVLVLTLAKNTLNKEDNTTVLLFGNYYPL